MKASYQLMLLACLVLYASTAAAQAKKKKPLFTYGFEYTDEQCEADFSFLIDHIDLHKGDIIAEVGAASGCLEGCMSVLTDSVTYYSQDVEKHFLNEKEFRKMVSYYSAVRKRPQTNSFHFVLGTEHATALPDEAFDKIIIRNSLHEFTYVNDMLKDISQKLKPGGKLVIEERISQPGKPLILPGCFITAYTETELTNLLKRHELYLTSQMYPDSVENNVFVFEKNKAVSDRFLAGKKKLQILSDKMDLLDSLTFVSDTLALATLEGYFKSEKNEITSVYRSFERWISTMGYAWIDQKQYEAAVNVFKLYTRLYPQSSNAYDGLADAYVAWGKQEQAMLYYEKAVEVNPACIGSKAKIARLRDKK